MKKTLNFAAIHFSIAFTVAYLLTGDIILGSLIAMLEPMVNTVAFYFHEKLWAQYSPLQRFAQSATIKTTSFAVIHFNVAFGVAYLMTGSFLIGGVMAMIEPSINTCAYYFYEKFWQRKHAATWHPAHCSH
ncbi:DUF2061 domain-containing protein [Vibrio aestuarianus]|uniref:DUF2061 domain-containing protein n=1 Tax=Vibrio aestuarianus TaxID=28171 RepID=A0A7X6N6F8_9VIBR|nr:DUF2061 domain-containing protein [Vibrio aestuarianus]MDE1212895.1 DUF2061 domain-containing protein [Vibrio aestuarianus]MDE1217925.1 DUF2061 domain-containing protein [Vibrio aestuarianus]MDE1223113.1 DUF2061 domain-containing protein [Vibrio aestuarianus]MDE1226469.1 DUF2061 domain-containing protein [Vibrio aestuarianus]MDE1237644.1 DUF2061 domain-containing protein [Vibrio aestuarianus]